MRRVPNARRKVAKPKLMLAKTLGDGDDVAGWWASEKLDGVRAYWDGRKLISRDGTVFAVPDWWTALLPRDVHLDGELYMGRGRFDETSGAVRRESDPDAWTQVDYYVFDMPKSRAPFEQRQDELAQVVEDVTAAGDDLDAFHPLVAVPHVQVADAEEARDLAADYIDQGGEGVILRKPGSPYSGRRSGDMLKVKGYLDAEAVVTGIVPGKGKHAGRMGALKVKDDVTGVEYRVGTGFSDVERDHAAKVFPKGTLITVAFMERTKTGKPRHPRFIRIRSDRVERTRNPVEEPYRSAIHPSDLHRLENLEARWRSATTQAYAAYAAGDVEVAERLDANAEELADQLEGVLTEIEEVGGEDVDWGPFVPETEVVAPPALERSFAAEYAEYLRARRFFDENRGRTAPGSRPLASQYWNPDEVEEILRARLRSMASRFPTFRQDDVTDAELVEAAADAYAVQQERFARRETTRLRRSLLR